jgi:acetolactate decarboxylase
MMKQWKLVNRIAILAICLAFFTAFASAQTPNAMYQVSTINALLQGVYEGEISIKELKQQGNFGIGTFEGLDGEMVVVDGSYYHVKASGEVIQVKDDVKTPFANVVSFKPEIFGEIRNVETFGELEKALDAIIKDRNYVYAIRIDGVANVKTRSIPKQTKPYPTLAEAAKTQSVFDINTAGTIVGFWCPQYVNGINVPGYHLHFISSDRKAGGHILSGGVVAGKVQIAKIIDFRMILPGSGAFQKAALNNDYSKELKAVEQSK